MKITIEDVAKEANVSITTVSRVINKNYPVKHETRQKVEAAIQKLNFTPNILARGLIQKKTYAIGVLVPSITNSFFPTVVNAIQDYFQTKGYTILLCDTKGDAKMEEIQILNLLERRVDGIISVDPRSLNIKNGYYEKIAQSIPIVLINGYSENIPLNYVLNDQESGTATALEYLISLNHKNIAFLRAKQSYSYDIKENIYRKVLQKHSFILNEENILVIEQGNSEKTVDLSAEITLKRLSCKDPPTAIFACNDWMAIGCIHAANTLKLNIPKDLSVIGFDNIIISRISMPKLTTVDQNMYRLGETTAKRLLEIMEKESTECKKIVLETKLVIRESCINI